MITSTFIWFFTIEEDSVGSDVTGTIDNPIVMCICIFDSIWLYPALQNEYMVTSIKLKTLSVASCSFYIRCAVNSFSNGFASFSAFCIFISLCKPWNQPFIHDIGDNLMHHVIFWDTDTMISYKPLTWIIIHCEPLINRFRVFSIYSQANTIPIYTRLCVLFSPTVRSSLENS